MTIKLLDGVEIVIDNEKVALWDHNPNYTMFQIWLKESSDVIEIDRKNKTVTVE